MRSVVLLVTSLMLNLASADVGLFKGWGLIGDSLINIELTLSDDSSVSGFYEYSQFKKPITVSGFHREGSIVIRADNNGNERFSLVINDGQLNGTWYSGGSQRRVIATTPYTTTTWRNYRTFEECLSSQSELAVGQSVSRELYRTAKEVVELFRSGDKDELISRLSRYSQEEKVWLSKLPIELIFDESFVREVGSADLPCTSMDDGIMISRGDLWVSDNGMIVNRPAIEFETIYRPSPKILTYKGKIVPIQCLSAGWANSDNFEFLGEVLGGGNDESSEDLRIGSSRYLKKKYTGELCKNGRCEVLIPSLEQCIDFDGEYVSTGGIMVWGNVGTSESYILREKLDNEFCQRHIEESEFWVKHCIMIERFQYRGKQSYEAFAISHDHYVIPLIEETSTVPLEARYIEIDYILEASTRSYENFNQFKLRRVINSDLERRRLLCCGKREIDAQSGLKVAKVYSGVYSGGNASTPFLIISDGDEIYEPVPAGGIFDFSPDAMSFSEDGDLVLEGSNYAEGDGRCCPSLEEKRVYGVRNGKIVRLK